MRFSVLAEFFCGFAVLDDFFLRFCGFLYTPMPPSLGVRHAFLLHVRGAGTRDEPLRTSAWEANLTLTRLRF